MKLPTSMRDRVLVALFVGLQILVPSAFLGVRWINEGSQPTIEFPFSWQMYSKAPKIEYFGIDSVGHETVLNTDTLTPVLRGVAYDDSVPEMLCKANPALVAVQRRSAEPTLADFTEVVAC